MFYMQLLHWIILSYFNAESVEGIRVDVSIENYEYNLCAVYGHGDVDVKETQKRWALQDINFIQSS